MAHTDGSVFPNPDGVGGWAVVLEDGRELSGRDECATNNRMEIRAVIEAMQAGATEIHCDSTYVTGIINKGWKRKANHDLWAEFDLVRGPSVVFEYVKGHDGNPANERADVLAGEARLSASLDPAA